MHQELRPGEEVAGQLLEASRAGRVLRCGSQPVAAADIRRACLAAARGEADPFGLRLERAQVTGSLDLRAATVPVPLSFATCDFTDPLVVEGADLHELVVTDGRREGKQEGPPESASTLPGLLGDGVRIAHDLVLSGTVIRADLRTRASIAHTSAVSLTDADIGGRLLAVGTRIIATTGLAMTASRARIRGEVRLAYGFEAIGAVRLLAARLDGYLDLSGVRLSSDDGPALDLNEATVGGSVFLIDAVSRGDRPQIRGRLELGRAVIQGQLLIRNADLHASSWDPPTSLSEQTTGRPALLAPHLVVHGRCEIQGSTLVNGAVALQCADLRSGVRFDGAAIDNAGEVALDLSNAVLGAGLHLAGATVRGMISLPHARVAGLVDLSAAAVTEPVEQRCVRAEGLRVDGDLGMRGLTATGRLDFRGATVAGVVDAEDAEIINPGDNTLSLQQAQVQGNVRLCGRFRSVGLLVLDRATIGGRLRCDGATLAWRPGGTLDRPNPLGLAVEAISAKVLGGIDLGWQITAGGVDLTGVITTYLADRPETDWPADTWLGGFHYERWIYATDAPSRIRWLTRLRPNDPRAWTQAARVLRDGGDHDGADALLIAQRRHARKTRAVPRNAFQRAFDALQDVTVRYGFRPQRALGVLLMLIAAVSISLSLPAARATMRTTDQNAAVFTTDGAERPGPVGACGGGQVRCFNAFFYAVDTVVPIIDLKQRATWYPSPDRGGTVLEWWLNICTILGWTASTIFALSFTRLGRGGTG